MCVFVCGGELYIVYISENVFFISMYNKMYNLIMTNIMYETILYQ